MKNFKLFSNENHYGLPTVNRRSTDGQSQGHYFLGLTKLLCTITLLLTLGVGQMWGANYTVYLYTGSFTNWENDGATFQIWDGSANHNMTSLGNHWYSVSWSNDGKSYTGAYIKRCASNWGSEWNSFAASISSTANVWKVTNWGAGSTFTNYNITVSAGSNGSVSPSSVKAGSSIPSWTFTATPNTNYAFVNWTRSNSNATINNANAATTNVTTASGTCTITANFAPQWTLKGGDSDDTDPDDAMGNWETFNNFALTSGTTMKCTLALAAKTTYSFKIVDRRTNTWYGNNSAFMGQTSSLTMNSSHGDCHITTAKAGNYIFTFDNSAKTLTVTYPTETHPSVNYIYFKNTASWSTVYAHMWNATHTADAYPGPALPTFTFNGGTYYYAAIGSETTVIFGNNNDARKTGDLASANTHTRQYYEYSSSSWKDFTVSISYKDVGNTAFSGTHEVGYPTIHTYGTSTTLDSPTKDNYTFDGWFSYSSGSGSAVTSIGATDKSADFTLYAKWSEITHDVRAHYGTGGSAATPSSWTAFGVVTGGAVSATNATGYHFNGWTIDGGAGGSFTDASSASTTFFPVTNNTWITANFAPNTYSISLDKNGGDSDGSVTATYNSGTLTSFSAAARAGYSCDGYFDDPDPGEGNMIIDANGNLQLNKSGYTNASGWSKTTTPTTLYAHWTVNATYYTLHFAKGTSSTFYISSVSAEKTSDGSAISDNASIVSGTGVTVTATPNDHYKIVGWYSAAGCAANTLVSTDNPYSFSISGNTNLFAKAEQMTTTITLDANGGAGGPSSVTATHGSNTLSPTISTKPTRNGYTLAGWYTAESGGTKIINSTGYTASSVSGYTDASGNWTYTESTLTLYAHWTEQKKTLTPTVDYNGGATPATPYTATSANTVGVATTTVLTASSPNAEHYTFAGWTLTNLTVTSGNAATDLSITVKITDYSQAISAVAEYEEVLETPYIVTGGNKIVTNGTTWRTTADDDNKMLKASGHSTESVAYFTVPVDATNNTGGSNANYKFKIYNTSTSTYYGLNASGQYWVLRENDNGVARTLGNYADIELRADVTGDYLLKVDYSSTPTLTVYFPLAVTWTAASVYSGNAATIAATVNDIESGKSIRFDVYAGSTATGDIIATWSGTTSSTSHTQNLSVTPSFGANESSKQYTVKVTYNGAQTATYTSYVYRKWDIYVQNNCSWASGILYYGFGNGESATWPGTACSVYSGTWYTVTLDGRYPTCVLNNNNNKEQTNDVTVDIEDYEPETFWNFAWTHDYDGTKYYNLNSVSVTAPTVTLTTYDVISTTQIYVQGTITNFGNDGNSAADMQEVGFKIGETEYTTTCTSGSTFERYITGLTANTSYSVKAYATNLAGTGESSATAHTTRATGTYTIKVRSGVSDPVPYIYAFVWSDGGCGGSNTTANDDYPGVPMTLDITGTTYKWYSYTMSNEYSKFKISENSSNETNDFDAPLEDKCYWYHSYEATQSNRMGTMSCPYTTPQLMIEETAGEEDFQYLEMSTTPSIAKTVTLAAKSTYLFKIVYNAEWYGKASVNLSREANSASGLSAAVEDNMAITTDVAGDYTFTFTTPGTITVTYQPAYTVTFGMGTGGGTISASATSAGGAITSGDYVAAGDNVTFTQTASSEGYTFAGWYDAESGGSAVANMGVSDNVLNSIGANATVYSRYTPNNYTVTFDAATNGGTCATGSKSVTFDAEYGELPVATKSNAYFKGWFTAYSGGTKVESSTIVSTAANHTLFAQFENSSLVTVTYMSGASELYPATSVTASPTVLSPEITAPVIIGYTFTGWTVTSGTASFGDASAATTTVNASTLATVKANYSSEPTVFFKNNLGWEEVYVTFNAGWTSVGGKDIPNNNGKPYFQMNQLGESDVFYCLIPETYTASDYAGWQGSIAFDNHGFAATENVGSCTAFDAGEFLGRGDFDPNVTMFIPYNGDSETRNGGTYYRTGCWMKYNSTESGYRVQVNEWIEGEHDDTYLVDLTSNIAGGYEFTAVIDLAKGNNFGYGFKLYKHKIKNNDAIWYSNTGDIYSTTNSLPWHFWTNDVTATSRRCGLYTTAAGLYTFTVSFGTGRPVVNVEYPVSEGDYRLVYKDRAAWSGDAHDASWHHPSRVIKAKENAIDTVSFYVSKAEGANAQVLLQQCTGIVGSTATWNAGTTVNISSITGTGIYNFIVTQDGSKNATAAYDKGYEGNFYIRTDASDGGWSNFKTSGSNTMTWSEYSMEHGGSAGPYSHYFMRHVNAGQNIKFVIANDFSQCISDTIASDTYTNEYAEVEANVRFMWNHSTNKINRAYLAGSAYAADRFLVLEGDEHMYDKDGHPLTGDYQISGLEEHEMNFTDDQNWIYETTVQANPTERIKLSAKFNNKVQYFYGAEGERSEETTYQLIGGTGDDKYKVRVVYDFKTNRLVTAWMPDGDITTAFEVDADIMIIRDHQADAQQITFSGVGSKLTEVKTVYGAMMFNKWTLNNMDRGEGHNNLSPELSRTERDLFFISFPFDVKLNDVFGFGTYGKHWIIEYYDGKGRAEKGYWKDSPTNWKFVTKGMMNTYTLKANEGYVLALDLDELGLGSSVWNNGVETVYLYFPSTATVDNIQATTKEVRIDQTGYYCSINRGDGTEGDRRVKDSYWHLLGVPSYANASHPTSGSWVDTTVPNQDPATWTSSAPYIYDWDADANLFGVVSSSTLAFKPMHAYLAQYARDTIYWSQVNTTIPSGISARRSESTKRFYEFRLEMQQNGEEKDHTFISLRNDEEVTNGFDFNYDLCKMLYGAFTSANNLYTIIDGYVEAAGNCMPISDQTTVVPVGVQVGTDGDYTFTIPEGTNGVGVTLVDSETGIRTSLSAMDYTINLEKGTYNNRFVIEISPVKPVATGVDEINGNNGDDVNGARKVLIDNALYIVKDGVIYDARGARVQ